MYISLFLFSLWFIILCGIGVYLGGKLLILANVDLTTLIIGILLMVLGCGGMIYTFYKLFN